jgi:NAD(P)-dependent dehydrogenase (short-subunit alcohol dehydrogenase family)
MGRIYYSSMSELTESPSESLAGRHVVVTGGAGALGGAVVAAFRAAGAVCHIPMMEAEARAPAVEGVFHIPGVDLTQEAAVTALYARLPSDLWASVHLAGGFAMAGIAETTLADFRFQLDLNLTTAFLCCREAVRRFRARPGGGGGGGRIVNVASRAALEPEAKKTGYTVAKAGVVALTRARGRAPAAARPRARGRVDPGQRGRAGEHRHPREPRRRNGPRAHDQPRRRRRGHRLAGLAREHRRLRRGGPRLRRLLGTRQALVTSSDKQSQRFTIQ